MGSIVELTANRPVKDGKPVMASMLTTVQANGTQARSSSPSSGPK